MPEEIPEKLVGLVKDLVKQGKSEAEIRELMKKAGFSGESIDNVISVARPPEEKKTKSEKAQKSFRAPPVSKKTILLAAALVVAVIGALFFLSAQKGAPPAMGPLPAGDMMPPTDFPPPPTGLVSTCKNSLYSAITSSADPWLSSGNRTSLDPESMSKLVNALLSNGSSALRGISDLGCVDELGLRNLPNLNLDLTVLASMGNLKYLSFENTNISDFSGLANMGNLAELTITRQNVKDLTPIGTLKNLERLTLAETNVTDITALSGLANLKRLDLRTTMVSDIAPLATLGKIEFLDLAYTNITDLSPLAGKKSLKEIALMGTNLPSPKCDEFRALLGNTTIKC